MKESTDILQKTKDFVDQSFGGKQKEHFERTIYWFEQFSPVFSEAHAVAAYAHDIERAFKDPTIPEPDDYLAISFLRAHEEAGAKIIADFLREQGQIEEFIRTVSRLISRHEEGGDAEQDALKDADSVSFFETNAEIFVTSKALKEDYAKVKHKLDWMYERISSPQAQAAVKSNYHKWVAELDTRFSN